MKGKNKNERTIFPAMHSEDWQDCLRRWLDAHPHTRRTEKGKGINRSVTMAVTAWKRFCEYYHFPFKDL